MTKKDFALFFLPSYLSLYLITHFIIMYFTWNQTLNYYVAFYGRKVLPFALLILFLYRKRFSRISNLITKALILSAYVIFLYVVYCNVYGIPFNSIGFSWTYLAVSQWIIGVLVLTLLFYIKTKDLTASLVTGYLLAHLGGLIYELPLYVVKVMRIDHVHFTFPFYIATVYLIPLFLTPILKGFKWRPNKKFLLGLIFYGAFSVYYGLSQTVLTGFFSRLVTISFLCMIPLEIEKQK